ncbi:hypothetical protein [Halorussus halobius]|uniref:hypothetical protein n=1 Tax=Halorussus halobius TaxID=1710537 RepID=UPI0010918931|nr:hypothetical protein [Halorussus halobius]
MQRRAATVYAVLFLVIAAGAYSLVGVADSPTIDLDGETYTENESLPVAGYEYTVASVGDGEGTLTRVNESSVYTATLDNDTTVDLDDETYRVLIANTSDPDEFTLREEFDLGENVTNVTQDGTEYIVRNESDGNRTLVPRSEYERQRFGEPDTRTYAENDTFDYQGNETTVTNVTADAAQLQYVAPATEETSLAEGGNVTLGPNGEEAFVAHFPEEGVVQLSTDLEGYDEQVEEIDRFDERIAGLWGVAILSGLTLILLVGLAFLPNK